MRLAVVQRILGLLLMVFSITMLPPVAVSVYFNDGAIHAFEQAFGITLVGGFLLWFPARRQVQELRLRDGFLIVAAFWIGLGSVGALPFLFMEAPSLSLLELLKSGDPRTPSLIIRYIVPKLSPHRTSSSPSEFQSATWIHE